MSLRGTSIAGSVSNSQTASLTTIDVPGGGTTSAVAGDLCILLCTAGYPSTALTGSGWTTLVLFTGGIWNYYFAYKVLSSGDISTGSVTVNQSNTYDGTIGLAVFTSGTSFIEYQVNTGSSSPFSNTCTSAVLSTSIGVYWGSPRSGGGVPAVSLSVGAGTATQRETVAVVNSRSTLWTQSMPGGAQTNTLTGGGLATVFFQAFVDGGAGRIFLTSGLDGLGKFGQLKGGCNG